MSGGNSSDEGGMYDDGLSIKPPQAHSSSSSRHHRPHHHHRRHKDKEGRKRDKDNKAGGSGGSSSGRDRGHHGGGGGKQKYGEEVRYREDRGFDRKQQKESKDKGSSSSSSKHHSRSSGGGGGSSGRRYPVAGEEKSRGEYELLYEMKKERRNMELERERALREIERRREKETGELNYEDEGTGRSSKHKRDRRERDKGGVSRSSGRDKEKRSRMERSPQAPHEHRDEEDDEEDIDIRRREFDDRLNLEVQDIEDSGSDLEEGEERSPVPLLKDDEAGRGGQHHGEASDKSDVSSASEGEDGHVGKPSTKEVSDVSSSTPTSRKSPSDNKSDVSSASSSSSSESEESDDETVKKEKEGEDYIPTKRSRKSDRADLSVSPPADSNAKEESTGQFATPVAATTAPEDVQIIEEEEEDLLPPYYPAIQGCRRVEEFQLLNRIEEGTYGVVYRAKEKRTDEVVALKRLKMEKEKDGFPITSLREINTLLKAQHENIVTVREIVVGSNTDKIFLVMDYVEHDLKALMETLKQKGQVFLPEEVKCLMIQLLRAVAHLHDNWILHRDLKTSNLLLSHKGILKVGDFGLAREYGSPLKAYTPIVVTLWYRAPELLLGAKEYSTPIDAWSVGCIFGELLKMEPMFPGKSEANQLNLIFQSLGTPNDRIWPGYSQLPLLQKMTFADYPVNKLKTRFGHLTDKGIDLMNRFLTFNPAKRITAEDALDHSFFKEMPIPIDPSMFPTWPAKSELGHRKAAASPKPPSGGQQFKGLKDDEDSSGFFLGGGDARRQPLGAGFSLRF